MSSVAAVSQPTNSIPAAAGGLSPAPASSSSSAFPAAISVQQPTLTSGLSSLRDAISLQRAIRIAPEVLAPIGYSPTVELEAHQDIHPWIYEIEAREEKEKANKKQQSRANATDDNSDALDDEEQQKYGAPAASSSSSSSSSRFGPQTLLRDLTAQFSSLARTVQTGSDFIPRDDTQAPSSATSTAPLFQLTVTRKSCEYSGPISNVAHSDAARWHAHGVVSPYGDVRTQQTVVDSTVREAREISCAEFSVSDAVIRRVEALWATHFLPKKVHAEAYKLNVYGEGVGFDWHRDTPETGLVGTFLLALYNNSNGHLQLKPDSNSKVERWHTRYHSQALDWCAFYPDIPHAVSRIEASNDPTDEPPYRAAIAFKIFTQQNVVQDAADSTAFRESLNRAVEKAADQLPLPFGVHLRHEYSLGTATLKGIDAIMLAALKSIPNTRVETLPVLLQYTHSYQPQCDEPPRRVELSTAIFPLTDVHLQLLRSLPEDAEERRAYMNSMIDHPDAVTLIYENGSVENTWTWKAALLAPRNVPDWIRSLSGRVPFYSLRSIKSSMEEPIHQTVDDGSHYTGNDSRAAYEDSLYLQYALVVLPNGPLPPAQVSDWNLNERPHIVRLLEVGNDEDEPPPESSRCVVC